MSLATWQLVSHRAIIGFGVVIFIAALSRRVSYSIYSCLSTTQNSSDLSADRSGEQSFQNRRNFALWGAILTIVFVGLILIFIAWIIATIGVLLNENHQGNSYQHTTLWLALHQHQPQVSHQISGEQGTAPTAAQPVDATATFCPHCGKQLPPA